MNTGIIRCTILLLVMGLAAVTRAADGVDYLRDIKPLLAEKCNSCHGALEQEAGLRLDAGSFILSGGDEGAAVVPGDATASLLIERVASDDADERMPPDGEGEPLDEAQIALLTVWINEGAATPEDEEIPVDPREHWAYQPPVRPPLPEVDGALSSNPIDVLLAREQQQLGLKPIEPADEMTLLRRLYFDLIGLPPTRDQQQAFAANESPDAWREQVDALLASPHYGERWARHWMDVWRYSDWDGYKQEIRGSQRHIWRWRDWIVRSLNDDKGYDRMIVEMLAGDEVAPGDADVLPATGFLGRNFHNSNRDMWLDATVEHTSKALLGLTLNCARCHEHKYDPIPQQAYYRFRAIFEPHNVRTEQLPGVPNVKQDGISLAFDADPDVATFVYLQGNEKHPDKDNPVSPAVPDVLGGQLDIQPVSLPVETYFPALRRFAMEQQLAAADQQLAAAQRALADATAKAASGEPSTGDEPSPDVTLLEHKRNTARVKVRSIEARQAADRAKFLADNDDNDAAKVDELSLEAARAERRHNVAAASLAVYEQEVALRGAESSDEADDKKKQTGIDAAKKKLDEANTKLAEAKTAAELTDGEYTHVGKVYPQTSTGRRLALARWITAAENPLTARVAVNQIWLRHFGAPLVDNVFDFGLRSARPQHAELLDWLAVELMENSWSTKHVHRLIVTSDTWRRASSSVDETAAHNRELDPDNHALWRMNVRRLEAEIVRDSVLAVAGELDNSLGGAEIAYSEGESSPRRSIYLQHAYEKQMTMLVQFDAASPNECYRRSESIVPQQALALANSSLSLEKSRVLARRLWQEADPDDTTEEAGNATNAPNRFVDIAFRQVLSRGPTDAERDACLEFLDQQTVILADTSVLSSFVGGAESTVKPAADPHQRARENLVQVLLNHNDFVTVR